MKRVLFFLLFLVACQVGPQAINPNIGTDGIKMVFPQNAPPDTILENTAFPVRISAANLGAEDVPYDKLLFTFSTDPLYITGGMNPLYPEKADLEIDMSKERKILHGKSLEYPRGESRMYTVPSSDAFMAKKTFGTREKPTTEMVANVCYAYSTLLTTNVCVDANIYADNLRKQVCVQEDMQFSGGQGAPVEITLVEVETYPIVDPVLGTEAVRPSFIIHMRNAADGRVVGPQSLDFKQACLLNSVPKDEVAAVEVSAFLLNAELECTPNPAKLYNGEVETRCTVPVNELTDSLYSSKQNFQTVLIVNLSYLYSSSIKKQLDVKRMRELDLDGTVLEEVPGYWYENGVLVRHKDTGEPLMNCLKESINPSPGSVVQPGWSCSCDYSTCVRKSVPKRGNAPGCDLTFGLCRAREYCCGAVPKDGVDDASEEASISP